MSGRVLTQRPDHTLAFVSVAAGVLVVVAFLYKPQERLHSGGDHGVTSFRNGGQYSDTRRASFNRVHDQYNPGKNPVLSEFLAFVSLLVGALFLTYRNGKTRVKAEI